ncbi:MAG: hypothetical protein AAGA85_27360 [Bacteroidota bacterium]
MDKALNEIGKLRNEMKLGFIELENQIQNRNDQLVDQIQETSKVTVATLQRFSQSVEKGFLAVESALDKDLVDLRSEIKGIKERLDKANI